MESNFGIKDLYQASLIATQTTKIGNRIFFEGEPVLVFNEVQLMEINEKTKLAAARGGFHNPALIVWESKEPLMFSLTQGVISKLGLSILIGAELISKNDDIVIHKNEDELELDGHGDVELKFSPLLDKPYFCYLKDGGALQDKIECSITNNILHCGIENANKVVFISYYFIYNGMSTTFKVDHRSFLGAFAFEGRFYSKDNVSGLNVTNILTIPKVSVISNLNFTMGEKANPLLSSFFFSALPFLNNESKNEVLNIVQLNEDIDATL